MIFPRALTNALLCALLFCFLLALLVVDLNINLVLRIPDIPLLALYLFPTYGLAVSLGAILVASIYRFFVTRPPRKGFLSPRFLTLGFSLLTLIFLAVFRENMVHFASFSTPATHRTLTIQMGAFFFAAAAGLVLLYRYIHHRQGRTYLSAFFGIAGAAFLLAAVLRAGFPAPEKHFQLSQLEPHRITRKVTVLNLEGLSFDFIYALVTDRKLPAFAYLMESGAWGHLSGFTPNDPFVLRRTLRTGKLPGKHRRLSGVQYRVPGFMGRIEVVPRFILFRQLTRLGLLKIESYDSEPVVKDIETIYGEEQAVVVRSENSIPAPDAGVPEKGGDDKQFLSIYKDLEAETSPVCRLLRAALARDEDTEGRAFRAKTETLPQLFFLSLDGLSDVQACFYKYSVPGVFGDIQPGEIQKFGAVIERYYQYYDRIISKYTAAMKDDEILIVCSPFGVEPLPFWKRLVEWVLGNPDVSAYHEQAPDGAVFVYGRGVSRGRSADGMRLADIAPTLLYFAGMPVAKDMDGYVRTTLFTREFKEQNPLITISSYEDVTVRKTP